MTTKRLNRPRDPLQLTNLIGDIATGQIEDRADAIISHPLAQNIRQVTLSG